MARQKYLCSKHKSYHWVDTTIGKEHRRYQSGMLISSGQTYEVKKKVHTRRENILTRGERDEKWMKKPASERTINGVVYENPAKKIGDRVFQLADIFPIAEWENIDNLMDDLKDRYEYKKEGMGINYRLTKRKNHVEVWRTYNRY